MFSLLICGVGARCSGGVTIITVLDLVLYINISSFVTKFREGVGSVHYFMYST